MTSFLRTVFGAVAALLLHGAQAQGGIRAILWNYEPLFEEPAGAEAQFGLGHDRDLNERMSLNVSFMLVSEGGWMASYRSAYHFSDNDASSFYIGPTVGVRNVDVHGGMLVFPMGMRMGVRGGLERFYADLYAGAHINVGAGKRPLTETGMGYYDLRTGSFCVGLDLGWGWAGR